MAITFLFLRHESHTNQSGIRDHKTGVSWNPHRSQTRASATSACWGKCWWDWTWHCDTRCAKIFFFFFFFVITVLQLLNVNSCILFFWDKVRVEKLHLDHLTPSPKEAVLYIIWKSVAISTRWDLCDLANGCRSGWGVYLTLVLSSQLLLQFPIPGTWFPLSLVNHLFILWRRWHSDFLYPHPYFGSVSCYNAAGFGCISVDLQSQGTLAFVLVYWI